MDRQTDKLTDRQMERTETDRQTDKLIDRQTDRTQTDRQTDRCEQGFERLHRPLVWFEQLAGELAEDAQVGQIRRHGRFRRLAEVLEHKVRAVPAHVDKTHTRTQVCTKLFQQR